MGGRGCEAAEGDPLTTYDVSTHGSDTDENPHLLDVGLHAQGEQPVLGNLLQRRGCPVKHGAGPEQPLHRTGCRAVQVSHAAYPILSPHER